LSSVDSALPGSCGCPPPNRSVLLAADAPNSTPPETKLPESMELSRTDDAAKPAPPAGGNGADASAPSPQVGVTAGGPETAALPASKPSDVQVQVEAPFVFRAGDPPPAGAIMAPPLGETAALPATSIERPSLPTTIVLAPPEGGAASRPHHGFFGKVKGFFSAVFG
jgi:hypothetical protein